MGQDQEENLPQGTDVAFMYFIISLRFTIRFIYFSLFLNLLFDYVFYSEMCENARSVAALCPKPQACFMLPHTKVDSQLFHSPRIKLCYIKLYLNADVQQKTQAPVSHHTLESKMSVL